MGEAREVTVMGASGAVLGVTAARAEAYRSPESHAEQASNRF
jgi:hypothetical protein